MDLTSPPEELSEERIRHHYEFLRSRLIRLSYPVGSLVMPPIKVFIISRDRFVDFVRDYAARAPDGYVAGQLEEYGKVRPIEEAAREAVGWCFGPYGGRGWYLIIMREDYTDPHLGAEILHVFEGQLGIRHGTLEQRFKEFLEASGGIF